MATVRELLNSGVERLRSAGSESPRLDAELLLGASVGVDRTVLLAHPEAPVGTGPEERYVADLDRRAGGEPVAYIRGVKEFFGLAFTVDRRALIPRPETELIVDLAIREIDDRLAARPRPPGTPPLRVVDVGTGAGTIAVTLGVLLRRRRAIADVEILATDDSADAIALARENAVGHGVADRVRFVEADLLPPVVTNPFDVLCANLPYVASDALPSLPIAASFEPRSALDGGPDGLSVIARLVDRLADCIVGDGVALFEIGFDQADAFASLAASRLAGWSCRIEQDLAGLPRVARLSPPATTVVAEAGSFAIATSGAGRDR